MAVGGGDFEPEPSAAAALILSRLPLKWRVHAAPPVEPEGAWLRVETGRSEILKTVHYLVWSRQMEPC